MTYHLLYVIRQIKLGTGGSVGQKFCCLLTSQPSQQHDATRRVPTDLPEPLLHEVVRSGPGSIAKCGASLTSRRVISSTGSQARLGMPYSSVRQRWQSAVGAITENDLHRCPSIIASSYKYSFCETHSTYIYNAILFYNSYHLMRLQWQLWLWLWLWLQLQLKLQQCLLQCLQVCIGK